MATRLFVDVKGIKFAEDKEFETVEFDVRITNDKYGISLSIYNANDGLMYLVPIDEDMLKALIKEG